MHEQSETVRRGAGWGNVYGRSTPRAGEPLPREYRFERDTYPTVDAAVKAARRRSKYAGVRTKQAREVVRRLRVRR